MKRRARFVMFMLSAAVLAGAWLLAAYMAAGSAEEAVRLTGEGESIRLSAGSEDEITALSWSWEGQTVNLNRDETGRWINGDDETCPVDGARAEALARAAASVTASAEIPAVKDLAQYGLESPALTVVAATEESITGWDVGNMSVSGEYYLRLHGTDAVYRTDGTLAAAFRVGIGELVALEAVPEDIRAVTELSVESEAGNYRIDWDAAEERWSRTDGEDPVPLNEDGARALYETLTELELTDCVTWNGRPEDYGLDAPQASAQLTYRDEAGAERSFALEFGDYTEGGAFARFAGSGMVFRVPGAVPDTLMYPRWEQMAPTPVVTLSPDTIASFSLTLDGTGYEIARLEEEVERPVAQGDETVTVTDVIYSMNGWVLDTQRMNGWLESFSRLTADGSAPAGEGRETLFSITFTWKDLESAPFTLEIRNYDSAHYLCLAGNGRLLVSRDTADELMARLRSILANK